MDQLREAFPAEMFDAHPVVLVGVAEVETTDARILGVDMSGMLVHAPLQARIIPLDDGRFVARLHVWREGKWRATDAMCIGSARSVMTKIVFFEDLIEKGWEYIEWAGTPEEDE